MYKIELSAQGSKQIYNLDEKPSNVNALRTALSLTGGELIFPGGKKLKGEDPVPFDADGQVKIRAFGQQQISMKTPLAAPSSKPPIEKSSIAPESDDSKTDFGGISVASISNSNTSENVVIKGLSSKGETRVHVPSSATYADVKRMLVSQEGCEVSDPSSIKFIGKGGKTPKDDELVPITTTGGGIVTLRAVRTERGHDELVKKVEVSDIIKRIEDAEKTVVQIRGRLFDPETSLLETRRIKHEMEDAISWLRNSNKATDYIQRAQAILNSL